MSQNKNRIKFKDFQIVFNQVWEFIVINIIVCIMYITFLLLIDTEYIEKKLNNKIFLNMEMLITISFILVQIFIFILLTIKKYKLSHKTIESLLKGDENNLLELKSSIRWDFNLNNRNKQLEHSILKTIAGFSNAVGGTLLIGVSDDKEIIGLQYDYNTLKRKDRDGFIQYLSKIITYSLGNNIMKNLSIKIRNYEKKEICRVDVLPDKNPVFVSHNGKDGFYIRTANITIPLSVKETYQYLQRRKIKI